ncbi:MAG TPA: PQQ-binding-like beta-propeller repeat protein [Anaeromyxobacter sp.]|nr:PQQ-binding-like beta-propeller repeat protein [Anaeromyxobacter sp.]
MTGLALALLLAAGPGVARSLPPAPVALYHVVWERPFVPARALESGPAERGGVAVDPTTGLAIFGTRDGWLHAVRHDGTVAWEIEGEGTFGPPTVEGDTVYVGSSGGKLYAVAIPTGKERWVYKSEEDLSTRPAVAHGSVFVSSLQDTVFCVDQASGAWKWHHRRAQRGEGFTIFGEASVVAGPDAVYSAYSDGYAAALDPATGSPRWEKQIAPPDDHLDVDAIALDGSRLYAAAYSGAVLAVNARTGEVAWTSKVPAAAQLAVAGGVVVTVTATGIQALSTSNGAPLWTAPLGSGGTPAGAPTAAGKWILVPAGTAGLRWIELASGRTLRIFDPGTGVSGSPALLGRRVYVLSNGGALFALDLT